MQDTELQKEKINKALMNMLTPEQLASLAEQSRQEFRDKYNDPRKMAATTMESEIQRLEALAKQRSLTLGEKEGLASAREVIVDQWATTTSIEEAKGAAIVAAGLATVIAPELMLPLMGRMALGHLAAKASYEAYTSLGVPSSDAAFLSSVVEGAAGGHMPVGGDIAKGAALTKEAAAAASSEGGISKVEKLNIELQSYLGADYRSITNKAGDKVFLSKGGARCVRFDVKNPHGDKPHMHIQRIIDGEIVDATSIHRIRFKEVE